MSKLPALKLRYATPEQKARLSRWIAEWELDRDLADAGTPSRPAAPGSVPVSRPRRGRPVTKEPRPRPGQVRLLAPDATAAGDCPLYLAVLERDDTDFVCAPFGRFAEPCLPGELLTGREALLLRVLCVWNAVTLPGPRLRASWLVDDLSAAELSDAAAIRTSLRTGRPVPPLLATRVGPPCWHPDDPRQEYMRRERRRILSLAGEVLYPPHTASLKLAAEPHDPYDPKRGRGKA